MTEPPASIDTRLSDVSRDNVQLALMLVALNDLDRLACDVGNAYLNAAKKWSGLLLVRSLDQDWDQ